MAIIERKGRKLAPNQLSVLIVDDQPFYRELGAEICKSMGIFNVSTAIDGEDALEAVADARPSVIICDWIMPQMDGLEFTKKLRRLRDEKLRMTPIIMVTSNNLASQIEQARNCGVDTFALKPVSIKAIFDRFKEVIETPRNFVDSENYIGPCRRRNRKAENYNGQMRRFDDPIMLEASLAEENKAKAEMRTKTKVLRSLLIELNHGKTTNIKAIVATSSEILQMAKRISDTHLARVCWSLTSYIDKCNSSNPVKIDIVAKHLESMDVLINTPMSEEATRAELANGLHKIVRRAMQLDTSVVNVVIDEMFG